MASAGLTSVETAYRVAAVEGRTPARSELTPDEIAERLERWRPRVLKEMGRRRLWFDAPAAEREDQFQDVAFVLTTRPFASEEHLLRALWTGLGFRARDFWKSTRRREMSVGEFFEDASVEDAASPDELAVTAADWRAASDCLSELDPREQSVFRLIRGHELSRRKAARALGLSEAEVLRALYSSQRKIDQVAALLISGRLCARRSSAVRALARSEAHAQELEQARAHLSHCRPCLLAFRRYQAGLGSDVAALIPAPGAVAVDHFAHGSAHVIESLRYAFASLKHHAAVLMGRSPNAPSTAEALVGGGAGGAALGAKVVVGLCVTVAAGGSAFCLQTLGLLPDNGAQRGVPGHARSRAGGHLALPLLSPGSIIQAAAGAQPKPSPPAVSSATSPPSSANQSPPQTGVLSETPAAHKPPVSEALAPGPPRSSSSQSITVPTDRTPAAAASHIYVNHD